MLRRAHSKSRASRLLPFAVGMWVCHIQPPLLPRPGPSYVLASPQWSECFPRRTDRDDDLDRLDPNLPCHETLCRICIVHAQPEKPVPDHTDCTAPTRQHNELLIDRIQIRKSCLLSLADLDHTDHELLYWEYIIHVFCPGCEMFQVEQPSASTTYVQDNYYYV